MDELTTFYTDSFNNFIAWRRCYKNNQLKLEPKELIYIKI